MYSIFTMVTIITLISCNQDPVANEIATDEIGNFDELQKSSRVVVIKDKAKNLTFEVPINGETAERACSGKCGKRKVVMINKTRKKVYVIVSKGVANAPTLTKVIDEVIIERGKKVTKKYTVNNRETIRYKVYEHFD